MPFRDTTGPGSSGRSCCRRPSTWRTWPRTRPAPPTSLSTASRRLSRAAGSADTSTRRLQVSHFKRASSQKVSPLQYLLSQQWCPLHRVVLGVSPEALVLPAAVGGPESVQRGRGLVRVHLLQHPARPLSVRRVHPAGRERPQLPVHRGERLLVDVSKRANLELRLFKMSSV